MHSSFCVARRLQLPYPTPFERLILGKNTVCGSYIVLSIKQINIYLCLFGFLFNLAISSLPSPKKYVAGSRRSFGAVE